MSAMRSWILMAAVGALLHYSSALAQTPLGTEFAYQGLRQQ